MVEPPTNTPFENATDDFARFAVSQGFPPNLLWV